MVTRTPPAVIYAAGKLHTDRCSQTEPTGVPVAEIDDKTLAAAKRCRSCNPSSRLVDALIAGAALRLAKPEQLAPALRPNAGRVAGTSHARTVIVPSMLAPLRDAETAAPVPAVTDAPATAPTVSASALSVDERGFLYIGEQTCVDCNVSKRITSFPTSTSKGVRVRLDYCRECRTVRASQKASTK